MLFEDKKLQLESVENMFQCPIETVQAYSLMSAPVYVLMRLNQKLVSVKAPLDFFTPEELQRLRCHEVFYLPSFAKSSVRFQTSARVIRKVLSLKRSGFDLAPYEISKEVFMQLAPLWGKELFVEPFFMSIFADGLCEPLDSTMMIWARENSVSNHDHGLLLSGSVVFLLLHLGWCDLGELNSIRQEIYRKTVEEELLSEDRTELGGIIRSVNDMISKNRSIMLREIEFGEYDFFRKIFCRINSWSKINSNLKFNSESIYGEGGFAA